MNTRTMFSLILVILLQCTLSTAAPADMNPTIAFLDEVPVDAIVEAMGLPRSITMNPSSLAMKSDGNLIVGLHSAIVELDQRFNVITQHAAELTDSQSVGFAFKVGVTPGGMLYALPILGSQLIRVKDDTDSIETINSKMSPYAPFAVFPDGGMLTVEPSSGNALRSYQGKSVLMFPEKSGKRAKAFATSLDGTVWCLTVDGEVWAFLENGKTLQQTFPAVQPPHATGNQAQLKSANKSSASILGRWGLDRSTIKLMNGINFISLEFLADSRLVMMGGIDLKFEAVEGKGFWWFSEIPDARTAFTYSISDDILKLDSEQGHSFTLYREAELSGQAVAKGATAHIPKPVSADTSALTNAINQSIAFAVYPDGSLLFAGSNLVKVSGTGEIQWSIPLGVVSTQAKPSSISSCIFDTRTGLIILADNLGRRLLRYIDLQYCKENGIGGSLVDLAISRGVGEDDNVDLVLANKSSAHAYEDAGAVLMAFLAWKKVLELNPIDRLARERVDALHTGQMKSVVASQVIRTRKMLDIVGVESARPLYTKTMQLFEKIISENPADQAFRTQSKELSDYFRSKDLKSKTSPSPLEIIAINIDDIFPALIAWYAKNPIGKVTVLNRSDKPVEGMVLTIAMARFLDFPLEVPVARVIGPGESANLDLYLTLNPEILEVQEDMAVSSRISVSCRVNDADTLTSRTTTAVVRRRTSIVWSETGRISSFITSHDPGVTEFSHLAITSGSGSARSFAFERILFASRIWDALRRYGITYIADPDSPVTLALSSSTVTDTVRLPISTLLLHSGDCDDTTALYCSLLESAGIPTAIMTSPGHIFCAFDTGATESDAWMFQSAGFEFIINSGNIWLPIETTLLQGDFLSALAGATKIILQNRGRIPLEFIPLARVRSMYPPIPVVDSSGSVAIPDQALLRPIFETTLNALMDSLFTVPLRVLESRMRATSGKEKIQLQNQIGVMNARFGELNAAELAFQACIASSSTYVPVRVNMANTFMLQGHIDKAIESLKEALISNPDAPSLLLRLAQLYYQTGAFDDLIPVVEALQKGSPSLLSRNIYLTETGDQRGIRGSDSSTEASIWMVGP